MYKIWYELIISNTLNFWHQASGDVNMGGSIRRELHFK